MTWPTYPFSCTPQARPFFPLDLSPFSGSLASSRSWARTPNPAQVKGRAPLQLQQPVPDFQALQRCDSTSMLLWFALYNSIPIIWARASNEREAARDEGILSEGAGMNGREASLRHLPSSWLQGRGDSERGHRHERDRSFPATSSFPIPDRRVNTRIWKFLKNFHNN